MKKIITIALLLSTYAAASFANPMLSELESIQKNWAMVKYNPASDDAASEYLALANQASLLAFNYPDRSEPLIWQAINLSSYAGAVGGIKSLTKALPAVKQARDLLLKAEQIDASALNGSVYTSLGALYYQVPGWPIGFGDKKVAKLYLEKAYNNNANKLDAGYFYGDYLVKMKDYNRAKTVLEQALLEPELLNRPIADRGRREEIRSLLDQINTKLSG